MTLEKLVNGKILGSQELSVNNNAISQALNTKGLLDSYLTKEIAADSDTTQAFMRYLTVMKYSLGGKQPTTEEQYESLESIVLHTFCYLRKQGLPTETLKPFIYIMPYGRKYTAITSIDCYRSIASKTGLHAGTSHRVVSRDKNNQIISVIASIKKQRSALSKEIDVYEYEAEMKEYRAGKQGVWSNMPGVMLRKCAEAAALRMAFPEDLSSIYIEEEMNFDREDRQENSEVEAHHSVLSTIEKEAGALEKERLQEQENGLHDSKLCDEIKLKIESYKKFGGEALKNEVFDGINKIICDETRDKWNDAFTKRAEEIEERKAAEATIEEN